MLSPSRLYHHHHRFAGLLSFVQALEGFGCFCFPEDTRFRTRC